MGSGKSYIGKKVATKLGYQFIDLDEWIEHNQNSTIANIFTQQGEARFREIERDELQSLSNINNAVISTGGGAPCFFENMEWMNKHGKTIYLQTTPELLFQRLKNQSAKRPMLSDKSESELKQFITDKIKERETFYLQCQIHLHQDKNGDDIINEIASLIKP